MSQAQTPASDAAQAPAPMPDDEALARFKGCFGIQAKPIEDAYTAVTRLTGDIAARTRDKEVAEAELGSVRRNHEKGTPQRQKHTQQSVDDAQDKVAGLDAELADLRGKLAEATKTKDAAPVVAARTYAKLLGTRVEAAGHKVGELGKELVAALGVAVKEADKAKIDLAVRALSAAADALVGPIELDRTRKNIQARVTALGSASYRNDAVLQEIGAAAEGADIGALTGALETRLAAAERQSAAFKSRIDAVADGLDALKQSAALKEAAFKPLGDQVGALRKVAATALDDTVLGQLDLLEVGWNELRSDSAAAAKLRDKYEALRQAVQQRVDEFPGLSATHKSFTSALNKAKVGIKQAGTCAGSRDFDVALAYLDEADDWVTEYDARALAQGGEEAARKAGEAALKKKKEAAAAKVKADAAAQKALEESNTLDSLNAIGRNGRLRQWLARVGTLQDDGQVTVEAGSPQDLNGDRGTIEVRLRVRPAVPFVLDDVTFVVHYHPKVGAKAVSAGGSNMHCKAYIGAPSQRNIEMDQAPWVLALVPTLGVVRTMFP